MDDDFDKALYGFDTSGYFEIPVEWDVLVSASDTCLDGYAPGFVEKEIVKQLPASITYRIWQKQLGELGIVEIRKLRPSISQIYISGVPLNSEDTAPVWLEEKPGWDKKTEIALKEKTTDTYLLISKEIDKTKRKIKARQKNHQADVIKAYFERLNHENIWGENFEKPDVMKTNLNSQREKAGRPRNPEDDWAYEQVRILSRVGLTQKPFEWQAT